MQCITTSQRRYQRIGGNHPIFLFDGEFSDRHGTVAEEDLARLYLSQANTTMPTMLCLRMHTKRCEESEVGYATRNRPCSGSIYSALAELCGETGILWAAELSEKKPDAAPVDMDGVMNAAQLEAFQLLHEIERERRSKGRRGTKKDGQVDKE